MSEFNPFDSFSVSGFTTTLRQGWEAGRNEIEANGKTVRENEAEAKAEVIADVKEWLSDIPNLASFVVVIGVTHLVMNRAGVHGFFKRAGVQLLVNEARVWVVRPERAKKNYRDAWAQFQDLRS